jgi:hypothetical protein
MFMIVLLEVGISGAGRQARQSCYAGLQQEFFGIAPDRSLDSGLPFSFDLNRDHDLEIT